MLARRNRIASHSTHNRGVAQCRLRGDNAVSDVVVDGLVGEQVKTIINPHFITSNPAGALQSVHCTHGMFLLLDLQYRAILEAPLDNIRLL